MSDETKQKSVGVIQYGEMPFTATICHKYHGEMRYHWLVRATNDYFYNGQFNDMGWITIRTDEDGSKHAEFAYTRPWPMTAQHMRELAVIMDRLESEA